jgi:mono/diheme cytochrome c family protein
MRRRSGRVSLWAKYVVMGLSMVVMSGCHPMDNLLVAIFGRSMRDSPSFDPYENTLMPPDGSVPFSMANYPASPGAFNLGETDGTAMMPPLTQLDMVAFPEKASAYVNPVPATEESLARGEVMFARTCVPCHGNAGAGDGLVTQAGMLSQSLLVEPVLSRTDGYLYGMIRVGRGLMPAYGHQITNFDRWHIVNYVRTLQAAASSGAN